MILTDVCKRRTHVDRMMLVFKDVTRNAFPILSRYFRVFVTTGLNEQFMIRKSPSRYDVATAVIDVATVY